MASTTAQRFPKVARLWWYGTLWFALCHLMVLLTHPQIFFSPSSILPLDMEEGLRTNGEEDRFMSSPTTKRLLWKGTAVTHQVEEQQPPASQSFPRISLVVSHCRTNLDWLRAFCSGYSIHDITVFSKCGADVEVDILPPAQTKTTVLRLENLGRCDYNHAYLFANITQNAAAASHQPQHDDDDSNDIVVLVKDDMTGPSWFQLGRWRSLEEMISTVSSKSFACAMIPTRARNFAVSWWGWSFTLYDMSAYADLEVQGYFAKFFHTQAGKLRLSYPDNELKSAINHRFKSDYANLEEWREALRLPVPKKQRVAEVCYGGAFAVTKGNIKRHGHDVWDRLLRSLSRGDNIEEGHFAERTWAALLSNPLDEKEVDSLQRYSTATVTTLWDILWCNYLGIMMREVKSCKVYWGYYIMGFLLFQWISQRCRHRKRGRETIDKLV